MYFLAKWDSTHRFNKELYLGFTISICVHISHLKVTKIDESKFCALFYNHSYCASYSPVILVMHEGLKELFLYFLPTKVMFDIAAVCPPGPDAVHIYEPESDFAALSKVILDSLTIRDCESDPVIAVKPLTQLILGSGKPVALHVIETAVPVKVVTWLPTLTRRGFRVGSKTWMETLDESMTGNVGSVERSRKKM